MSTRANIIRGTPKTIDEMVERLEEAIRGCAGRDMTYAIVRDYLAQKFGVAYLRNSNTVIEELENLFKQLTERQTDDKN
jgi:transposase